MKKIGIVFIGLIISLLIVYIFFPSWILISAKVITTKLGGFENETIEINGQTCHYLDNHKTNKPLLIFLHGFADNKESWLHFVNPISKDYRIILLDLLGHGENERNINASYSFKSQAHFLNDFTTALELPNFQLIGISMGGGVASNYVALYPEQAASLTLISAAGVNCYSVPSKMDSLMLTYITVDEKVEQMPLLPHKITDASIQDFKDYLFFQPIFIPKRLFKVVMKQTIDNRDFYVKVMKDLVIPETGEFEDPLNDILANIHCPTLILWGKEDPLLNVSSVEVIKNGLPTPPEVVILADCGHATIAEKTKATRDALVTFLDKGHY